MNRRGMSIVLDTVMLLAFPTLMSWRFTGVPLHERVGMAFAAILVAHLVIHWGWVERQVESGRRVLRRRRLVPLALNLGILLAMATAVVSGVVISKVVVPNTLQAPDYLRWHGVHETAANFAVILLGLHLALNWDRVRTGVRHAFDRARRPAWAWRGGLATATRRLAWVIVVAMVVTGAVWTGTRLLPLRNDVLMIFADGHREHRAPPPEIARLEPGRGGADPARGVPKVLVSFAMVLVVAAVGRKGLARQQARRRADADGPPQLARVRADAHPRRGA